MSVYNQKKKHSKKERVGFYTALSICIVAVGMAAYSTYTSLTGYFDEGASSSVAVNNEATGITEEETAAEATTRQVTEAPTEAEVVTAEITIPVETKDALETMLTVNTSLSYPLDSAKILREYSEDSVYNKTLNQWEAHTGVDFACREGDNVYSMGDGEVTKIYSDDLYGTTAVVKSATYTAYYSGLAENVKVFKGNTVTTGDVIGTAEAVPCEALDDTHVHISVKVDGRYVDPLSLINNDE